MAFGLIDMQARMYSPLLGRFVSADTIVPGAGKLQALNRYTFVFNSPLRLIDPSGHYPRNPRQPKPEDGEPIDPPTVRFTQLPLQAKISYGF
jgi:RHS repeat-associated protein